MPHAEFYDQITASSLEEGALILRLTEHLRLAGRMLCRHMAEHETDAAKAKATVTLRIDLIAPDQVFGTHDQIAIRTSIQTTLPKPPPAYSFALTMPDEDGAPGQLALYARRSGTDDDNPLQRKLCTDDGRLIDQATGQVAEPVEDTNEKE